MSLFVIFYQGTTKQGQRSGGGRRDSWEEAKPGRQSAQRVQTHRSEDRHSVCGGWYNELVVQHCGARKPAEEETWVQPDGYLHDSLRGPLICLLSLGSTSLTNSFPDYWMCAGSGAASRGTRSQLSVTNGGASPFQQKWSPQKPRTSPQTSPQKQSTLTSFFQPVSKKR